MTISFSSVYHFRKTGSGHPDSYRDLQPGQVNPSPGLAKIAPCWLAHRDNLAAKAPGLVNGGSAPPTLTAYTRDPLGAIIATDTVTFNFHSFSRLPETVCGSTMTISLPTARSVPHDKSVSRDCRKPAFASQAAFV